LSKEKNVPASVRYKLLTLAKTTQRPFQELLQYYAMERFLYRLSKSAHAQIYPQMCPYAKGAQGA